MAFAISTEVFVVNRISTDSFDSERAVRVVAEPFGKGDFVIDKFDSARVGGGVYFGFDTAQVVFCTFLYPKSVNTTVLDNSVNLVDSLRSI